MSISGGGARETLEAFPVSSGHFCTRGKHRQEASGLRGSRVAPGLKFSGCPAHRGCLGFCGFHETMRFSFSIFRLFIKMVRWHLLLLMQRNKMSLLPPGEDFGWLSLNMRVCLNSASEWALCCSPDALGRSLGVSQWGGPLRALT